MKKIYFLIFGFCVLLLASCKTPPQKFNVAGTAGTQIYTSDMQRVGVIGSNGQAKVKLPSDGYFAYLLSKSPNSDLFVPFALDYKKKIYTTKAVGYAGVALGVAGLGVELSALAFGSKDIALAGLSACALGGYMTFPWLFHPKQTCYDYQFKYLSGQRTNGDIQFTQPVYTEPYKNFEQTAVENPIAESKPSIAPSSSTSRKHLTQKSSKTLRDYGKQTEGTYTGRGNLTKGGETIESYTNIVVKIVRVSKDIVSVNVVESDGSEFFETSSKYKIVKNKNGTFVLTNTDIRSATITIDKQGNLTYSHPKVNIDGDVYSLKINAK